MFKPGDVVEITHVSEEESIFFKVGDRARLIDQNEDGDWFADFKMNEKYFFSHGVCCLQESVGTRFKKAN